MSNSLLPLLYQVNQILWMLLNGVMIYGAVLFYRIDRRPHGLCLVTGFSLQTLMGIWYLLLPLMVRMGSDGASSFSATAAPLGVNLIAHALIAYGFITVALIQWRKFKAPKFDDE